MRIRSRVVVLEPRCHDGAGRRLWPLRRRPAFRIGVLVPFTGAGAAEGPFLRNTVDLAFEEIHEMLAAGGSDVRFQFIVEDTATTPEGALAAIESLAAAGVQVVIGPYSSAASSGVRGFADANKILVISPSATSPALAIPNDYLFRLIVPDTLQGSAVAKLIDRDGYRQVIVFHRGDSYGAGMANAFKEVFEGQYGGTAQLLPYDPDLPDFAAEVQNLAHDVAAHGRQRHRGHAGGLPARRLEHFGPRPPRPDAEPGQVVRQQGRVFAGHVSAPRAGGNQRVHGVR